MKTRNTRKSIQRRKKETIHNNFFLGINKNTIYQAMQLLTSTNINEKYDYCRMRRHDDKSEAIAVPGFMSTSHAFRKSKLQQCRLFVIHALKMLPRNIRRSTGCKGVPWFLARRVVSQDKEYGLEVVDKLLAMAVALGLVTVVHPDDCAADVSYIIIEDLTAIRICKTQKEYRAAKWED